jgi:hypothetical protein
MLPAARRTTPAILAAMLAAVLLVVAIVEAPGASTRIFWRYAILSFDDPATQLFDEIASRSSSLTDPGFEAAGVARLPLVSRLVATSEPAALPSPALSSRSTRSPPAA